MEPDETGMIVDAPFCVIGVIRVLGGIFIASTVDIHGRLFFLVNLIPE